MKNIQQLFEEHQACKQKYETALHNCNAMVHVLENNKKHFTGGYEAAAKEYNYYKKELPERISTAYNVMNVVIHANVQMFGTGFAALKVACARYDVLPRLIETAKNEHSTLTVERLTQEFEKLQQHKDFIFLHQKYHEYITEPKQPWRTAVLERQAADANPALQSRMKLFEALIIKPRAQISEYKAEADQQFDQMKRVANLAKTLVAEGAEDPQHLVEKMNGTSVTNGVHLSKNAVTTQSLKQSYIALSMKYADV